MKLLTFLAPWPHAAKAHRAMALLGAAVFVVSLGYGAGLPLLQLYLAQYLGSAEPQRVAWHVGMLGGVYTFALFLFAPWWGRLSDRRGRTVVLMAGFAAFLVGSAGAQSRRRLRSPPAGRGRRGGDRADGAGLHR